MSEVDELRSRLESAGYSTTPSHDAPDEYTVNGTDQGTTPVLVLNEAALAAYLNDLEQEAVDAFGEGTDPRSGARSLVELNIVEALEARPTLRIGVAAGGWVEETADRPSPPRDLDDPDELEWSAEPRR